MVRISNYFQDSLGPHTFCLIGNFWKPCSVLVCISQCCALLPRVPNTAHSQAGIWKISVLVLHWDVKTIPQSTWHTSGITNRGQIIYSSTQEHNYAKEGMGVHYVMWCKETQRNAPVMTKDSALQSTRNFTFNMNFFFLLTLSPVTCPLLKCA